MVLSPLKVLWMNERRKFTLHSVISNWYWTITRECMGRQTVTQFYVVFITTLYGHSTTPLYGPVRRRG